MNIAEKLKDAPKGTKLYSPIFGDVTFKCLHNLGIKVLDSANIVREFYNDGRFYMHGECMLFPSKDNKDWDNFSICPFKKGDFIVRECLDGTKFIAIFSHFDSPYEYTTNYLCLLKPDRTFKPKSDFGIGNIHEARLATKEEKEELLDVIKRKGYTWNSDTLTLEKINKYNIYSLKPFSKVLVRDVSSDYWKAGIYSHYNGNCSEYEYVCVANLYKQCIPYNDETKHLLGTNQDCPDYYKTW